MRSEFETAMRELRRVKAKNRSSPDHREKSRQTRREIYTRYLQQGYDYIELEYDQPEFLQGEDILEGFREDVTAITYAKRFD